MIYAYLQMANDAEADKVGAEARAFPLNDSGFAQGFGAAAIPARLALERGRWAEAAKLELPPTAAADSWKRG